MPWGKLSMLKLLLVEFRNLLMICDDPLGHPVVSFCLWSLILEVFFSTKMMVYGDPSILILQLIWYFNDGWCIEICCRNLNWSLIVIPSFVRPDIIILSLQFSLNFLLAYVFPCLVGCISYWLFGFLVSKTPTSWEWRFFFSYGRISIKCLLYIFPFFTLILFLTCPLTKIKLRLFHWLPTSIWCKNPI